MGNEEIPHSGTRAPARTASDGTARPASGPCAAANASRATSRSTSPSGANARGPRALASEKSSAGDLLRIGAARGARLLEDEVAVEEPLGRVDALRLRVPGDGLVVPERVREEVEEHLLRDGAGDPHADLGRPPPGSAAVALPLLGVERHEERRVAHDRRGIELRAAAADEHHLGGAGRGAGRRDRGRPRAWPSGAPARGVAPGIELRGSPVAVEGRRLLVTPSSCLRLRSTAAPPPTLTPMRRSRSGSKRARAASSNSCASSSRSDGPVGGSRAPLERAPVPQVPLADERREHRAVVAHAARAPPRRAAALARVEREREHAPADLVGAPPRVDRAEPDEQLRRRRRPPRRAADRATRPSSAPSAASSSTVCERSTRRISGVSCSGRASRSASCRGEARARAACRPRDRRAAWPTRGSSSRWRAWAAPTTAHARTTRTSPLSIDRDDALDGDARLGDVRREDDLALRRRAATARSCSAGGRSPCSGTSTRSFSDASFAQASIARRISAAPGRKTST